MYEAGSNSNYMITFAVRWRHWGGGPGEDIFVEFGLSQREYFMKLLSLLEFNIGVAADLAPAVRGEIVQICHDRLRGHHRMPS